MLNPRAFGILRLIWKGLVFGLLLASAGQTHAAERFAYAKRDADPDRWLTDIAECVQVGRRARVDSVIVGVPVSTNPASIVGAALIAEFGVAFEEASAARTAQDACMDAKGYSKVRLNNDESQALNAATTDDAKKLWLFHFLSQDLSRRIAPIVPPLPEVRPEPFGLGGLRIIPASLAPGVTAVVEGGVLATASAEHRLTGRIHQGPDTNVIVPLGEAFHYEEVRGPDHSISAYWCGPYRRSKHLNQAICLQRHSLSQFSHRSQYGPDWLANPKPSTNDPDLDDGWFWIEPSSTDLVGPMAVSFELTSMRRDALTVSIKAERENETVKVWSGSLPLDSNGHAALPLWTKTLNLDVQGASVAVRLTDGGNGKGPQDS